MNALNQYLSLYAEHKAVIESHAPAVLNARRQASYQRLQADKRLPERGDEGYPAISINEMFAPDYGVNINRVTFDADVAQSFRCGVPNVSTLMALVVNDTFRPTSGLERGLPEGVTIMSLAQAASEMPELVDKYYGRLGGEAKFNPADPHYSADAKSEPTAVYDLNTMLAQDGVFIHVARGVKLERPIQIVNISNASAPVMAVRRVLAVVEDGASASVLVCDHSSNSETQYLNCQVVELYVGRDARLDYYDLEESSDSTSRCSSLYAQQQANSELTINGTTLLGGHTRNNYYVAHAGTHAATRLVGMAIASGSQVVDNATCVMHLQPECQSDQMFKYILDDKSRGSFSGTIVVDERAPFTRAYQSNRNVLASSDARMYTRPQLEIYCDEVKCSHGATVGQLDANALFYMRQRGIPEDQAKMMLMQAFMSDVIDTVSIPALKSRLHQLVEHRLAGGLELCSTCQAPC